VSAAPYEPAELLGPLNDVETKNAPRVLFAAGDVSLLRTGRRVSIVGSRKASPEGLRTARTLAETLASRGLIVVSGLAEGIDTAAHEGAIAAGGRTIAVLGTSLEEFFPARNRPLQERIMREHLAISQFVPGVPSQPGNFPMRNRTMALISDATVIVEAGEKSGSLHQGWEALRLGRPLFLMSSLLANESLEWPKEMQRYGADSLALDDVEHLFELLPERARGEASEIAF
jgi:DNA processing protein